MPSHGESVSPVASHFDDLAGRYRSLTDWITEPRTLEAVCRRVSALPVLDVGCGPAIVGSALRDAFGHDRVVNLDVSLSMCIAARAGGFAAVQAAAERLPFSDDAFGTVVCRQGLHYFDVDAALREWSRVLRRGGRAVVAQIGSTTPEQTDFWDEVKRRTQPLRRRWFSTASLENMAQEAGWRIEEVDVLNVDNVRSIDQFFVNSPCDAGQRAALLARWQAGAPTEVAFEADEENVRFRQHWLIWVMAPVEEQRA